MRIYAICTHTGSPGASSPTHTYGTWRRRRGAGSYIILYNTMLMRASSFLESYAAKISLSPLAISPKATGRGIPSRSLSLAKTAGSVVAGVAPQLPPPQPTLSIFTRRGTISPHTHTHTYIYALYMIAKKTTQPVDSDNISSCICVYIYTTYGSVFCVGESVTTLQPVYIYVCIYV